MVHTFKKKKTTQARWLTPKMNGPQRTACFLKDVQGGIPESDLLGVTVALIHVAGQRFFCYRNFTPSCSWDDEADCQKNVVC